MKFNSFSFLNSLIIQFIALEEQNGSLFHFLSIFNFGGNSLIYIWKITLKEKNWEIRKMSRFFFSKSFADWFNRLFKLSAKI